MTTPTAGHATGSLRVLFVWALLGYVALHLFFELVNWLLPTDGRAGVLSGANFIVPYTLGFPIIAVLLASHVAPALGSARLAALVATVEYGALVLLGMLSFLLDLVDTRGAFDVFDMFGHVVLSFALVAITALTGYATYRVWTALGGALPR